ncbi:hypothetical protein EYF80_037541 [Liparis tanakae]|uniref:Uncharacterized protein n=1 Tax=Liparis tanakae TaxID=230148 RepID=A0A4Z2GGK1_9TELE|nr:hypothetical protein EYF80_037541 [Liparis tanakae]
MTGTRKAVAGEPLRIRLSSSDDPVCTESSGDAAGLGASGGSWLSSAPEETRSGRGESMWAPPGEIWIRSSSSCPRLDSTSTSGSSSSSSTTLSLSEFGDGLRVFTHRSEGRDVADFPLGGLVPGLVLVVPGGGGLGAGAALCAVLRVVRVVVAVFGCVRAAVAVV